MNKKLKEALKAYTRARSRVFALKRRYYPPGKSIEVKGYGTTHILDSGGARPVDQLYVKLVGGHHLTVFLSDIIQPKKAKVTK